MVNRFCLSLKILLKEWQFWVRMFDSESQNDCVNRQKFIRYFKKPSSQVNLPMSRDLGLTCVTVEIEWLFQMMSLFLGEKDNEQSFQKCCNQSYIYLALMILFFPSLCCIYDSHLCFLEIYLLFIILISDLHCIKDSIQLGNEWRIKITMD